MIKSKRNISFSLILLSFVVVFSCIKPFDPAISSDISTKYVVSGRVTDAEGWQEVTVSLSSPIEHPEYIPVSGCTVEIQDDHGNSFTADEFETGKYHAWIEKQYLVPGTSYRVHLFTPGYEELVSDYDRMNLCPPLDSVTYQIHLLPTTNPDIYHQQIQFYIDLKGEGYDNRYYKWEVEETWEYDVPHAKEYYYDGGFHKIDPPDSSQLVCYIGGLFPKVFTLSTASFASKDYPEFPLHFFDGTSSRLSILYSILVRQMALSEAAYYYWEQLRINSSQEGGLYEKQPLAIKGNMANLSDPEKEVLGYFYAASESTKRLFYKDVEGLDLNFYNYCQEETLGRMGWKEFRPADYPVFYYYTEYGGLYILNKECVDCTLRGGSTVKPEFWP